MTLKTNKGNRPKGVEGGRGKLTDINVSTRHNYVRLLRCYEVRRNPLGNPLRAEGVKRGQGSDDLRLCCRKTIAPPTASPSPGGRRRRRPPDASKAAGDYYGKNGPDLFGVVHT